MSDEHKYPKSSPGIAGMLNITPEENKPTLPAEEAESGDIFDNSSESFTAEKTAPPPVGLPIAEEVIAPIETESVEHSALDAIAVTPVAPHEEVDLEALAAENEPNHDQNRLWSLAKTILPYLVIFAIGVGLYFYYFSSFSFLDLINKNKLKIESVTTEETNANLEQLKNDVASDYKIWISQFFVDVNDESIIAMDADVSGNGLSNLEKYLLNLNPKVYSTRAADGDGQMVIDGINPWTGKAFTDRQKSLIEKYINPEIISNRITAAAITRGVTKYAQYVNPDSPYYIDPATLAQLQQTNQFLGSNNQSADNQNTNTGSTGSINNSTSSSTSAGSAVNNNSGASSSVVRTSTGEIDLSKPGLLEIPANKISVPLIWTQDVKDFDRDLKKGIVHYPGTALPGEVGTSYISGHSSGYVWDKSPYKTIFASLGNVTNGTSFTITVADKGGATIKYHYVVDRRAEFAANDQAQFLSTSDSVVALSTCWPVGTVDRRLVLFAKLTQTEK